MLELRKITSGYEDIEIVKGLSLKLEQGSITTIIGSNGVGKTTTIRTISGINKTWTGEILFEGKPIHDLPPHKRVEMGIVMVPEGRRLFPSLTVRENLQLGAFNKAAAAKADQRLDEVLDLFPRVGERLDQYAGTLSGGEQQMVAISRGLMSGPNILMLDEPSLGLAPIIVQQIFELISEVRRRGTTVLLVEQNVHKSLMISDYAWVMENGNVTINGTGKELMDNPEVKKAYLGL
ncbi:MAG: branched-chain amino acid ABC transporter ATP-binding protein [SAR116 cluster bacterium MED-G04]|jgi:branched-chain amino acid transport system ATP-binding protein|nr:branched-chain amino acid ABC transporter ATP-binding protein [SAR116 cluster bacterium]OUW36028.1 MAG: branched-chain amino acid ABC transporter ATP-binding protein [Gammaproteobacteria bacterium TMED183]PDH64732.1 MAG: branched-chain amino acid ABC transporter ATP-binding protein [SAR116 cluster bacterium MED-G04]HCD50571.1 branched-chain amino acid ABC transporter ATP-binding protein [Alphaproteobacteria bacterium]CAI8384472.1 MAG: High-affinity branched-chain amino acid transport ATP-bin